MALMVATVTRAPPIAVRASWWYYLSAKLGAVGVAGISKGSTHHDQRGECITEISAALRGGDGDVDGDTRTSTTPLVTGRVL